MADTVTDTVTPTPEIDLEQEMREWGKNRFQKKVEKATSKGNETRTSAGKTLLHQVMDPSQALREKGFQGFPEAICDWLKTAGRGGVGKGHKVAPYISQLDPHVTAYLTAKQVIDSLSAGQNWTKAAVSVGTLLEDEVRFGEFAEQEPNIWKWINRENRDKTYRHFRTVAVFKANKSGIDLTTWEESVKQQVGVILIHLFAKATGLIEFEEWKTAKGGRDYYIKPSEGTKDWIRRKHQNDALMCPFFMPTIAEPRPWTSPYDGGYWSGFLNRQTDLVKTNNKRYLMELESHEMPEVYEAVNEVQRTRWQINTPVYDVMTHLWYNMADCPVLPTLEGYSLPPKPADIDTNDEARKQWRRDAHKVHEANKSLESRQAQVRQTLTVASRFRDEEVMYFPHSLDFRGRLYPIPMYLSPQGADYSKALLQFAEGVEIGEEGAHWLAVHGANCWGEDKVSLGERIKWVFDNEGMIEAIAADPYDNQTWMDAEEPWQFLAFCFEWMAFREEGPTYKSKLPVGMDGTCNGLQHFSAMLRDEVGGEAVCLVSTEAPRDIYQMVANQVLPQVRTDANNEALSRAARYIKDKREADHTDVAQDWLNSEKIDRKIAKRPTMTLPYGATQRGFREQIEAELKDQVMDGTHLPFRYDSYDHTEYMGRLIWDELDNVVQSAKSAMDWLKQAAKLVSKDGVPINWTVPTGFVVQQAYKKEKAHRVATNVEGRYIKLTLREETDTINAAKQQNGIAPNFVHSLDAAHLMKTVLACRERGVKDFKLVHDSFACHAANASILAWELRKEFVQMYQEDLLADFRDEVREQMSSKSQEKLPALPEKGNLDIEQVLESWYFFN